MGLTNLSALGSAALGGWFYASWSGHWGPTVSFHLLVLVGALSTAACWLLFPLLEGNVLTVLTVQPSGTCTRRGLAPAAWSVTVTVLPLHLHVQHMVVQVNPRNAQRRPGGRQTRCDPAPVHGRLEPEESVQHHLRHQDRLEELLVQSQAARARCLPARCLALGSL